MYDYLLVGAGLYNAVFAETALRHGRSCLVVERRNHIGGNCYTYEQAGIIVHKYGAHIFRTSDRKVWDYLGHFAEFNHFVNSPIARYHDETYNLPFNMNTFAELWHVFTPSEAQEKIRETSAHVHQPVRNLEEHAIHLVGTDIYERLIKGYTEKQWGRKCTELPASIMRRLPLRFTYDNNYYRDRYQGIPIGGYTRIIEQMMQGADIRLNVDFDQHRDELKSIARHIIYTGPIDAYYDFCYGPLAYRSLRFETKELPLSNYQGVAVVNYTSADVPYTRVIEHKHFEFGEQAHTVVTWEYPHAWHRGEEAYYPVNDEANQALYERYRKRAEKEQNLSFGGRLGNYRYTDMQDTVKDAWALWENLEG